MLAKETRGRAFSLPPSNPSSRRLTSQVHTALGSAIFGWSLRRYRINSEDAEAHPPLKALSDVVGQIPLRGFADRRGRSSSGRNGSRYVARSLERLEIQCFPYNHTALIDVAGQEQKGRARHSQRVQVEQLVILPQDRLGKRSPRGTYDLAFLIDAVGHTADIARQLTQGLHAACLSPNECFIMSCSSRHRVGEADDCPLIIDCCGGVPGIASDVPKVSRNTVLPKYRVFSADTPDRNTTID